MPAESGNSQLLPWHGDVWNKLQARRAQGSLPHALLLSGPAGTGKQQLARHLAMALVCERTPLETQPCGTCKSCHLALNGTHPDIHWLMPEEQGKQIRIDAMRNLIARTSLTTQSAGSRVFLISPADAMNRNAANALLKTLEEPGSSSILVLLSSRPQALPATVRSRCQELTLRPVDRDTAKAWLASQVEAPDIDDLLALAGGAPLTALKAAQEGWLARAQQLIEDLLALKTRQRNPMQIADAWAKCDLSALLADLGRVTHDLVQWLAAGQAGHLLLPRQSGRLQTLAKDINLTELFAYIDGLNEIRLRTMNNLNPGMLLERLVVDWLALTRRRAG